MYLKRYRLLKIALVPGVVLILIGAGCGGDDNKKSGTGTLSVSVDADRFAGPTPLNVKFSAKPKNAVGEVHYRWRFDDGTQSEGESPSHSFPRAGYYTVILDVRDESGNNTRQSLLLGAWPPQQWATAQTKPLTKKGAINTQKVQQHRTDVRHAELRREFRQKIEAGS
jgi:PKD domain-containing protein